MLVQKPFQDIITFTRASAATRFNASGVLETVGNNVPRIDHDPITLACRGLLIEEQRTNMLVNSDAASGSGWTPLAITVLSNVTDFLAPDGTYAFDKLVETSDNNVHQTSASIVAAAATTYTASRYVRAGERRRISLFTTSPGMPDARATFNLVDGSVASANECTAGIRNIGNGIFRVWQTFTSVTGGTTVFRTQLALNDLSISYTGTVGNGAFVWGAQIEAGAEPTSHIPTGGTQATRAASDCKISTLSPWFSQQGGVLLLDYLPMGGDGVVAEFHNTANNRWGVTRAANGDMTAATVSAGTADGSAVVAGASPAGQIRRAAISLAANDLRISVNGGAVSKDASVSLPVNLSVLQLGARQGLTTPFNGWLRKVRYIPKPVASDAELQALSTI